MGDAKKEIEKKPPGPRERFLTLCKTSAEEFAVAIPLSVAGGDITRAMDRVVAGVRAIAARNPDVYSCTPASVGRAMALSALTGLVPGGPMPHVDLIPRRVKPKDGSPEYLELNWQIGFRGYLELAARAGCRAKPVVVYQGEHFVWMEGLDEVLEHKPDPSVKGYGTWDAITHAYVVARFRDGTKGFAVLPKRELQRRRSKAQSDKFWSEWPVEMTMKTVIRYAAARGQLAFDEVAHAVIEHDGDADREDLPTPRTITIDATVGALPDSDPLGQDDHEEREKDKVPAGGGTMDELAGEFGGQGQGEGGGSGARGGAPDPEEEERAYLLAEIASEEQRLGAERVKAIRGFEEIKRFDPRAPVAKLKKYLSALSGAGTKKDEPKGNGITAETRYAITTLEADLPGGLVDDVRAEHKVEKLSDLPETRALAYLAALRQRANPS